MSSRKNKKRIATHSGGTVSAVVQSTPRQVIYHCLFLFFLAFVIYSNSLNNGYVLDDSLFITGNNYTLNGIDGIKDIWTHDAFVGAHGRAFDLEGGRYRPLAITLFAVEYELFGLNPFTGHFVNVLLFALTAVVFYLFLLRLFQGFNAWIPLIAAAIFTVHPIHTEVVANIKSRDEILALLFLLSSMYMVLSKEKRLLFTAPLFYFLALLSKENTVTALALVPLTLIMFRNQSLRSSLIRSLPFFAVAIVYIAMRTKFAGSFGEREATNIMDSPYIFASIPDKYATITAVCGKYLRLLFLPYPLSYDYSFNAIPITGWSDFKAIVSLLVYILSGGFAIRTLYNHAIVSTPQKKINTGFDWKLFFAYGILFYLITFSIVSNFLFNIGAPMGERFLYLPSAGFCMAVSVALAHLLKIDVRDRFFIKPLWILPLIIIIPAFGYASFQRNKAWKDNFTLYETDIKTVPNSARARLFYGIELLGVHYKNKGEKELREAIAEMEEACRINPEFYHAFYNLGLAYQAKGDHAAAVKVFERVFQIEPKHINTHYYLGMSYGQGFKQYDKAVEYIELGIKYGYDGADRYTNLGISYAMKGALKEALNAFETGLQKTPENSAMLLMNMGITYEQLGEKTKGQECFTKAYKLDPSLRKSTSSPADLLPPSNKN